MKNGKELTLMIYNEKGQLEYDYPDSCYIEIQKIFGELMFLKNILKMNYRVNAKTNYDSTYKVTIKDMGNNWKYVFDGINSEKLRWY